MMGAGMLVSAERRKLLEKEMLVASRQQRTWEAMKVVLPMVVGNLLDKGCALEGRELECIKAAYTIAEQAAEYHEEQIKRECKQ